MLTPEHFVASNSEEPRLTARPGACCPTCGGLGYVASKPFRCIACDGSGCISALDVVTELQVSLASIRDLLLRAEALGEDENPDDLLHAATRLVVDAYAMVTQTDRSGLSGRPEDLAVTHCLEGLDWEYLPALHETLWGCEGDPDKPCRITASRLLADQAVEMTMTAAATIAKDWPGEAAAGSV